MNPSKYVRLLAPNVVHPMINHQPTIPQWWMPLANASHVHHSDPPGEDRRVIVCPLCDMAIPHTGDETVLFEAHMASGACVPKVKTETEMGKIRFDRIITESWHAEWHRQRVSLDINVE